MSEAMKQETVRGTEGYFRLGQSAAGAWWLLDPEGRPFFFKGVNEVGGRTDSTNDPAARLRTWDFNALGAGVDPTLREDGLPFVATAGLGDAGAVIRLGGVRLPDVYDLSWPAAASARAAEVCLPLCERRDLIGWLPDDTLAWGHAGAGRLGLLQVCLSLEPAAAVYHAAWEFVLAMHRGRIEALAKSWSVPLTNKEVVREMTRREEPLLSRGYLRDDARWTQEFARRYFSLASAAIRAHDSNHLVLSCRFGGRAPTAVLAECRYPAIDLPWVDLDDLPAIEAGPALAGDFNWTDERFIGSPGVRRTRGMTTVERMLRRGRATLERSAVHPSLVGYAWSRWQDLPGEQPPFASGLVHLNDVEAREHTELLTDLNGRIGEARRTKFAASNAEVEGRNGDTR
jgi:hypothetical protein